MIIYIDLEEQYRKIYRYCYFKLQHQQLAEDIIRFTTPIREKILAISEDVPYMDRVAAEGAEKARASAEKTIQDVRHIIGFR